MAELTRRYIVMQMATEGPFDIRDADAPFVLKPWKDPAALQPFGPIAITATKTLPGPRPVDRAIEMGPQVRGGVGSRNDQRKSSGTSRP